MNVIFKVSAIKCAQSTIKYMFLRSSLFCTSYKLCPNSLLLCFTFQHILKMEPKGNIVLEDGLDLSKVITTGSVLHINEDYTAGDDHFNPFEYENSSVNAIDFIGEPVNSFKELEKQMVCLDATGFVKKKILEEGGGFPLHRGCTVHIAYSGYWENESEPFDIRKPDKPLVVDLNDSGLLPGLQMAVESMLVGEMSVFLLSYDVMYGELGIPPRIKPKADSVFYVKLIKSTLTPKERKLDLSEPNSFERVYHEVKLLYASGATLFKSKNYYATIQLFRKAVFMLHKCRLANEEEEVKQEKMIVRLYTNLAICYNGVKKPFKACIACNELNRLNKLWNNGKALFQNAKALRMIGEYDAAEKRLTRAQKLCPDKKEIQTEFSTLEKLRISCNKSNLVMDRVGQADEATDSFKREVDNLIKNFKEDVDMQTLTLPTTLNSAEIEYVKEACLRENLYVNKMSTDFALGKEEASKEDSEEAYCLKNERLVADDPTSDLL